MFQSRGARTAGSPFFSRFVFALPRLVRLERARFLESPLVVLLGSRSGASASACAYPFTFFSTASTQFCTPHSCPMATSSSVMLTKSSGGRGGGISFVVSGSRNVGD